MASEGEKLEAQKNIISKLPKNSELSPHGSPPFYHYQGFWYGHLFLQGILKLQELDPSELNLTPSDVILCSCPKSGTTWLKALGFAISTRTRFDPNSKNHPLLASFPHDLVPYLETLGPNRDPELPLFSTHMPYSAFPKWVLGSGCKMVYICRNPKDVFVSFWHFRRKMAGPTQESIPLEKTFDLFSRGISGCGPYWEHVLEYWKASLDHPEKVLFLKYEDMMEDGESQVRKLAEFMGYPFSEEEEREGAVKRVVEICSFESLSKLEVNKGDHHSMVTTSGMVVKLSNSSYFRKAKVEDWKNYLTQEMANKLDGITVQKLANYGLTL